MFAMKLSGPLAVLATLSIAGVVCCAACTAGDICNDLKAGYLVCALPRNQQIVELLKPSGRLLHHAADPHDS